jgi:histidinol phosphatase-like enzyme (inositol monophosphatase family)
MQKERLLDQQAIASLLQTAVQAAQAPSAHILNYFQNPNCSVENKSDGTPVTIADREAEEIIRNVLSSHSLGELIDVLGEEYGFQGSGTRYRWTIDPIDGTRSFVHGIPLFGTIVALEDTVVQCALVGVIHLPVLNATYSAAHGLGCWHNGSPVNISVATRPEETIVAVGDPAQFSSAKQEEAYRRLQGLCPYLRGYTDCFGHTLVVSGAIGAMMDPALNPWDILATQILVEEAGGTMVMRPSAVEKKVDALFGNPELVKYLSAELSFS